MRSIDKKYEYEYLQLKGVLTDGKYKNYRRTMKDNSKRGKVYIEEPLYNRYIKNKPLQEIVNEISRMKTQRQNKNKSEGKA